ncbi:MAG TPA: ABC transporter permease [Gaiellaceae bacterium]
MTDTELQVRELAPATDSEAVLPAQRVERVTTIRPSPRRPHLDVPELWHYRELLGRFVWRDVKVRYKQTSLGIAWALLVPIFSAVIYVVVFGKFANFPAGDVPYATLVLSGLIVMQYFNSSLTGSSLSLVANLPLVTKVYFPRVLLPLAAALVPVVDFAVGFLVLIPLMLYYNVGPDGIELLAAPLFLALAFVTALGAGFFLATLNVRYRDVPHMLPAFMPVLPLVSGVPYAVQEIPEKWQWILAFNPMTAVIAGWRWAILGADAPNWAQTAVGVAVALAVFVVGLGIFRSSEPRFADTI